MVEALAGAVAAVNLAVLIAAAMKPPNDGPRAQEKSPESPSEEEEVNPANS